ncbi:MAG: mismatch repair protein [Terracidiphilus sp.]|nr:mismatch repair protein [Terracidiphilus sp.]
MTTCGQEESESRVVAETYRSLLAERKMRFAALDRRGRQLGWGKIALAAVELAIGLWFLSVRHGGWLLAIPLATFVILAIWHELILRKAHRMRLATKFYEHGLQRLEDHWAGAGDNGARFADEAHLYARDLDLFGPGSLFELLATVSTTAGAETLAAWLKAPAPVAEIRARQQAVQILSSQLEFREQLYITGGESEPGKKAAALTRWAEQSASMTRRTWFAGVLALLWIASAALAIAVHIFLPVFLLTVFNFWLNLRWNREIDNSADAAEDASAELEKLAKVLALFESKSFETERLRGLQEALKAEGITPSEAIRKLDRITNYLAARRNMMVRAFDGVLFYSLQLLFLAERWRTRHGHAVRNWIEALGEMEALLALAGYAHEHPDNCWPELVENEGPLFDAEGLAHPLLPANRSVRNNIALDRDCQLIVLSGTNMSGKSTFIRAIGITAVLAQCGAPVCAQRLRLSPLEVGASICVLDSLQGGISRFYAEIQRLKQIVDLTGKPHPVLFLLDELLSGTNSLDRRKGTEYLVRALVQHGAIGLVSTHDLSLTAIPETLGSSAANWHFEDRFEQGRLIFDYKLKPGAVKSSNALKLMQSVGLPCPD